MFVNWLLLVTLLPVPVKAQTLSWKRQLGTFDSDESRGVATDSKGNVYISGDTTGSLAGANQGNNDAWVAKYNSGGTLMWKRQLGTSNEDRSNGVATDSKGNVYISGDTTGSLAGANQGSTDDWVAKYNSGGTLVWKRQLGASNDGDSSGVATDSKGNVYISGSTQGSLAGANQGSRDAWVAKYNSAGTLVWKRQLGTSDDDTSSSVATDSKGNVYISGYTTGSLAGDLQGSTDDWVAKYNSGGTLVWKRQLGTSSRDGSSGVATDSKGNVYISGSTQGSLAGANQGSRDAWVAKYDSAGTLVWKRQLGTSDEDVSSSVATDSKGNVYISGDTQGPLAGAYQGYLIIIWETKYDSDGTLVWKPQLGTSNDAWVAKYNSAGTLVWKRQLGTSNDDRSNGVATDSKGNVYISGSTLGSLAGELQGSSDAWVVKYTQ